MKTPISLIIGLIAALVTMGNAPPPHRVYLPLIAQPRVYKGLAVADMTHFEDVYRLMEVAGV